MTTTTYADLADEVIAVLEALAPSSPTRPPWRRSLRRHDFRFWAMANAGACFRQFEIRRSTPEESPGTWDPSARRVMVGAQLAVAYPVGQPGLFGRGDRDDVERVIDADSRQIHDALMGPSALLAGHNATYVKILAPDRASEAVWFQDFELTFDFHRALNLT